MSLLFEPFRIGSLEVENRFVHSATYECLAEANGAVSTELIARYRNLARGRIGLIVPGHMFVHPQGRAQHGQTGIHDDEMIPGLKRLVEAVHQEGGRIVFQLAHAGRQTTPEIIGRTPRGPSARVRDPIYFFKPRALEDDEVLEIVRDFVRAADRAAEAGADGVQFHAAHGYLISQFLSPFINRRQDRWGGSEENRFRLLGEILVETRRNVPDGMALLAKMTGDEHLGPKGITPELAARYAGRLAELGLDGLEISGGNGTFSPMNVCRGDVPFEEFVQPFSWWMRPIGRLVMKSWAGKYDLIQGYNMEPARLVRSAVGNMPLAVVGGWRTLARMEQAVQEGPADLISMSRPFIREPFLVKRFMEGRAREAACVSCNKCLAIIPNAIPLRCYHSGFPKRK
ncbi:MAG: NADH:flavin oxidoreductase [Proteobacteria bacterium]|nr:NADH:flavin oxidoreductase [Pseudomonadota bacterium]